MPAKKNREDFSSDSDNSSSEIDKVRAAVVDEDSIMQSSVTATVSRGPKGTAERNERKKQFIGKPSLRQNYEPEEKEHEFGTTPEFMKHVASRLGLKLDSELEMTVPSSESNKSESNHMDTDFRLFSTSMPGTDVTMSTEDHNKWVRSKRNLEDTSDSDEDARLQSVAVSGVDILFHSAITSTPSATNDNISNSKETASNTNASNAGKVKVKKHKKKKSKS